jgi:phosphatidylglycerol:prolipoprotein diacylglycerol transferase
MQPVLGQIGPFAPRSYTTFVNLGLLIGLGLLVWRGWQLERRPVKWFDVGLVGAVGGMLGGRVEHIALNWDYFRDNAKEITMIWRGGLEWHGALLGALIAGYIAARLLRVPLGPLGDTLALALPVFTALSWQGCRFSTCGYGQEVRSLADYHSLLVEELPDLYYTVVPRFDTQLFGIAWSVATLAFAVVFTLTPILKGRRLWATLAVYSAGSLAIAGLRADAMPMVAGMRLDQWFDAAVIVGCVVGIVAGHTKTTGDQDLPDQP